MGYTLRRECVSENGDGNRKRGREEVSAEEKEGELYVSDSDHSG